MNRRSMYLAAGCAVLGLLMLAFGIHDVAGFHSTKQDRQQILTLGQVIDILTAAGLLLFAALVVISQVRAHRRHVKHRRWVQQHQL